MKPLKKISIESRKAIDTLVGEKKDFTAFDITKHVRSVLGSDVEVEHADVNATVRFLFGNGDMENYDRKVDTSLPTPSPYRYAPKDYFTTPKPSVASLKKAHKAALEDKRIRVLKGDVIKAGLNPGDIVDAIYIPSFSSVYIVDENSNVVINDPSAVYQKYSVDSKYNIRLNPFKLGCPEKDAEEIEFDPQTEMIVVQLT
jgi:hypothetical protein